MAQFCSESLVAGLSGLGVGGLLHFPDIRLAGLAVRLGWRGREREAVCGSGPRDGEREAAALRLLLVRWCSVRLGERLADLGRAALRPRLAV